LGGAEFVLRRRLQLHRVTEVQGGPFHGAIFSGSFTGREFRLEQADRLIARATAQMLSTTSRHLVRLIAKDEPMAETLTALMIVDLLIQKYEAS
jgi:uncharacterized protein YxjI